MKLYSEYSVFLLWHMHYTPSLHRREPPFSFENEVEITCVQNTFYTAILRVIILVFCNITYNKDFSSLTDNLTYKFASTAEKHPKFKSTIFFSS